MALTCYECRGTQDGCAKSTLEGNKDVYLKTCPVGADKCMRSFLKEDRKIQVISHCTNELGCDFAQAVKYSKDGKDLQSWLL